MARSLKLAVLAVCLGVAGCYHQVVRTGAPPGSVVIERPWTATFLFGLIPASVINTAAECPSGIAIVETQQTFVNGLVGALTLGIYTPQTVQITCAAGPAVAATHRMYLPARASLSDRAAAVRQAIELSRSTGETVVVGTTR